MKYRKRLVVLTITAIISGILAGGYFLFHRADIAVPSFLRPPSASRILMSMDGFRFSQLDGSDVPWSMDAQHADLYENKEARLKEIEIVFTGSDARTVALLGDEGILDTETGNATIRRGSRDVRVVTSDGYLLTTASLRWESGNKLVRTAAPFKLLGSGIYLEGKGISADTELHTIEVNSNVKAVLQE